ncbi:ImmA/IrrE family metallo-endopeptidase [Komagataeibacter xylinus]|uniref:ImmA/IrrE family metallo-endopeptidase n=1 Tax=Komagataeibacter xylinus TaxID=28448 RepID=UPI0010308D7D|nr:ImmA/IrrE family metallo-endopeptidase [Komagataeibacter xylinus]
MSGDSFVVPPKSWNEIERIASRWRSDLSLQNTPYFPIMEVLEKILDNRFGLFTLSPIDTKEMGNAEGYTDPDGKYIYLREDVYRKAWNREHRDRFTAAHEFGHWAMHTGLRLARLEPSQVVPSYKLSEPQANQFASELLMPAKFFSLHDTAEDVMQRHGVGYQAAFHRLNYLRKKGKIPE